MVGLRSFLESYDPIVSVKSEDTCTLSGYKLNCKVLRADLAPIHSPLYPQLRARYGGEPSNALLDEGISPVGLQG